MTIAFNSRMPNGVQKFEALQALFRFVLIFFGTLVFIDVFWSFLIKSATFYFSVFFFSSVFGSLLRVALSLPFLIILTVGTFLGISKALQIIGSLLAAWTTAYALDFFWANMIQARIWGFDVVMDGNLTPIGFLIGLMIASRDVLIAFCVAYIVLWRENK